MGSGPSAQPLMAGSIMDRMVIRVSSPILIGRTEELIHLNASLQLAIRGRSTTTLIAGEAGVGKTRLVSGARRHGEGDGARRARRRLHRPR